MKKWWHVASINTRSIEKQIHTFKYYSQHKILKRSHEFSWKSPNNNCLQRFHKIFMKWHFQTKQLDLE